MHQTVRGAKIKNTKYKIQNTKYKIQNTKYKIQYTKYKIQNTKYSSQLTGLSIGSDGNLPNRIIEDRQLFKTSFSNIFLVFG